MSAETKKKLHVAIVGGGLCGLALAVALERRGVAYTIHERQAAFAEIGAGLNVAPNAVAALDLVRPGLGAAVLALASRNAPDPDVWMLNRLGAPTARFPDAHVVARIRAPGVGHAAVGRYELLGLLASQIDGDKRARFGRQLVRVVQRPDDDVDHAHDHHDGGGGGGPSPHGRAVTLVFEDGTTDEADVVIGCDGIHSAVRRTLLRDPEADAKFTGIAGYRAVFPMDKLVEAVGLDIAGSSCIFSGPGGYSTLYSIEGGAKVNVGMWRRKEEYRERLAAQDQSWVMRDQKEAMLEDFKDWGPTTHKIMDLMGDATQLWTSHHHDKELDSCFDGRICVIGDAAHAMGPHQGQGASQAMEDAYVMAEVLAQINVPEAENIALSARAEAAFRAWEMVRKPQFEWVARASHEGFGWWADLWRPDLTEQDVDERSLDANARFSRLWNSNVGRQGEVARSATLHALKGCRDGLPATTQSYHHKAAKVAEPSTAWPSHLRSTAV